PSMPGIITSRRIRLGAISSTSSSALLAPSATTTRQPVPARTRLTMVRLTSSSSTARIVAVVSFIDDFDPGQIARQLVERLLRPGAAPRFGRALEGDRDAGDRVEAVAAARSFQAVRHGRDGFEIARGERAFDRRNVGAAVFHEARHQLLEIRVHPHPDRAACRAVLRSHRARSAYWRIRLTNWSREIGLVT